MPTESATPGTPRPPTPRLPWPLACAFASLLAACGQDAGLPARLELRDVAHLRSGAPLLLNDDVVLTFSEAIDGTTVNDQTVRVLDVESGEEAPGRLIISGRTLTFRPRAVRRPDLSDGGWVPGRSYELVLKGYPSAACIQSIDGNRLGRPLRVPCPLTPWVQDSGESSTLFRDGSPDLTRPLVIKPGEVGSSESLPIEWDEPLLVRCPEPLDPRSLDPMEFEIVRAFRSQGSRMPEGGLRQPESTLIRSVSLVSNFAENAAVPYSEAGALLRFVPDSRLPIDSSGMPVPFELRRRVGAEATRLVDFSGGAPPISVKFWAARRDVAGSEKPESFEFDFMNADEHATVLDLSSSGTAFWGETGRVEIRYPRAAGNGSDGSLTLQGAMGKTSLHGTRVRIPAGEELLLPPKGLVVIRAQGRIDLEGDLIRRTTEARVPMWEESGQMVSAGAASMESLSDWLKMAEESNQPWTVVIAGGDLVVRGKIDVDTPLLLVAGGWIRGRGRPKAAPGQLWLLGKGGGFELPHHRDPRARANVDPPLIIDEPIENPLREPLTFVAFSSPAPKVAAPRFWRAPEITAYERPGGKDTVKVQYLRVESGAFSEEGVSQAVRYDEPMGAMEPGGSGGRVRLRIELTVYPKRGRWDPPFLDRVRLSWTPEPR